MFAILYEVRIWALIATDADDIELEGKILEFFLEAYPSLKRDDQQKKACFL